MQEFGITSAEQKMIDDMYALSNQLVPLEDEAMKNVQGGNRSAALDYVYGTEYNASITQINTLKEQFLTTLDNRTSEQVNSTSEDANHANQASEEAMKHLMLCNEKMAALSAAIDEITNSSRQIGGITKAIQDISLQTNIDTTLSQMAQGNMNQMIGNDYRGEFLPIQRAMGQILDSFNSALSQINRTSGQVSEESDKMSSSAQNLADGATEQAAAVEELSASIQEISKH